MNFSNSLLQWYLQNKRDLPWRKTTDAYPIWLSEIMLQQTRVAQGMPYFLSFVKAFPTVVDLANADEEKVLKLWQGLGYYSRARNMHKTAQIVAFELDGKFPNNYTDLLKLKGIGDYTAAAIASFAFNEVVPVVDGNVFRVLSRYFDLETDISSATAKKEFAALAKELMPNDNPALFNQAIMEFGALQCVPKNPNCENCIFSSSCAALQKDKVHLLPIKTKKTKVTNRYFHYLIFEDADKSTLLNKRTEKGIWHNLYEFPVIETEKAVTQESIINRIKIDFQDYNITDVFAYEAPIVHKLSHQHLSISFYKVTVSSKLANGIPLNAIHSFPFPIVIFNFIEKYSI
ncbi:MAG: A/G-specific adenine glycosylase [Bacteroidota bacterium]